MRSEFRPSSSNSLRSTQHASHGDKNIRSTRPKTKISLNSGSRIPNRKIQRSPKEMASARPGRRLLCWKSAESPKPNASSAGRPRLRVSWASARCDTFNPASPLLRSPSSTQEQRAWPSVSIAALAKSEEEERRPFTQGCSKD